MATKFRVAPRHRRHHSWPPIRLLPSHLQHHTTHPARPAQRDMDEDPFAFFLSAPGDADDRFMPDADEESDDETYISDWMNANIQDAGPRRGLGRRTRSVSPFSRHSSSGNTGSDVTDNYAYAASHLPRPVSPGTAISMLRKWLDRMEKMYWHKKPAAAHAKHEMPVEPAYMPLPLSPPATPNGLNSPDMLPIPLPVSPSPPLRGRKRVRRSSQSVGNRAIRSHAGRVRVWREPAEDMYPLSEEEEYEEIASPLSV